MTTNDGQIEFRLLGAVEARRDGVVVPLGGARQQRLLALLLTAPGRAVSADRLIDELWAGEPPRGAEVTLRSYLSRLRASLRASNPVVAIAGGYRLDVDPDQIDAVRFVGLVIEAEAALQRSARRAASLLRDAFALWRGRPFAHLADHGSLQAEAERLEGVHLHALELRIQADLHLGAAAGLVTELEALVAEHPFQETLWRHLMLAHYRAGRQADALAAFHRAREALDRDLGLEPGEELEALQRSILRHDVPPVTPVPDRYNLPAPLTSFVGRGAELENVRGLLAAHRLVTLSGVGGVGKTRLALEAARSLLESFDDGVFFVDLAPLTDPQLVAAQVASTLGIRERQEGSVREHLAAHLRERELLLVLDNCEHVRDGAAALVHGLLGAAPRVHVIATSRERLGVPGEAEFPVPPLGLPTDRDDPEAIRDSEAVAMFLARARIARPALGEDAATLATAARICSDLDGLPLALELAAARTRALSLADIAARLDDRFRFLVSWRRISTARHRTLREAMDWSYELLEPEAQRLLAALSIFAGGFTLRSAADVCLDGDDAAALELLERLVEASLVTVDERTRETRYGLLETVRQYGAQLLRDAGRQDELARLHAEHFAAFAERLWISFREMPEAEAGWSDRLHDERANVRAALAWTDEAPDPNLRLRLAEANWYTWWLRGEFSEGRAWLEPALELAVDADPRLRAFGRHGAAGLAWAAGNLDVAWAHEQAARADFARFGEPFFEAGCANTLGVIALSRGDLATAQSMLEEALHLYRAAAGEPRQRELNGIALVLNNLGEVAVNRGDVVAAAGLFSEARANYVAAEDSEGAALEDLNLGLVAIMGGRPADARDLLSRALQAMWEAGFTLRVAEGIEGVAALANATGSGRDAAILLGGSQAIRDHIGAPAMSWYQRFREDAMADARTTLGQAALEAAFAEGRGLTPAEVVERGSVILAR